MNVRIPAAAGSFYAGEKAELAENLRELFGNQALWKKARAVNSKALIVPHAGHIYSGKTTAEGFLRLEGNNYVIIGPSHRFSFAGLVGSSAKFWETPLGRVKQNPVKNKILIPLNDDIHQDEHSIEVILPFLQAKHPEGDFSVVCLLSGIISNPRETAGDLLDIYPDAKFIFSSDLSHYLPEESARERDKRTIRAILDLDGAYFNREENTACGVEGIKILIEMAKIRKWRGKLAGYATSAAAGGDRNCVVGYASVIFTGEPTSL